MKKKLLMLPCIAAVAIATFVGTKTLESNAYESKELLLANVEALCNPDDSEGKYEYSDGYAYTSTCNVSISKYKRCKVEVIICQGGGNGCNSKKCPVHPA